MALTYCEKCDCSACPQKETCKGCMATGGSPFGGRCVIAEEVKRRGEYKNLKRQLVEEINGLGIEELKIGELYALLGSFVNLAYPINGREVKFLRDEDVYFGNQVERENGRCYGVVASDEFILVAEYGEMGAEPELICYKKR